MVPAEQRMDLRVDPALKQAVLAAAQDGESMNETATRLLCKALGLKVANHPVPRKSPGRRSKRKEG